MLRLLVCILRENETEYDVNACIIGGYFIKLSPSMYFDCDFESRASDNKK